MSSLSAQPKVKFDSDAPDKITTVLKGAFKIFEMDNAVTTLKGLSNPEHNSTIGEGLESSKAILEANPYGCTSAAHKVLGEPVDFVVAASVRLAMLKGFAIGNTGDEESDGSFCVQATELKSKSKRSLAKAEEGSRGSQDQVRLR